MFLRRLLNGGSFSFLPAGKLSGVVYRLCEHLMRLHDVPHEAWIHETSPYHHDAINVTREEESSVSTNVFVQVGDEDSQQSRRHDDWTFGEELTR